MARASIFQAIINRDETQLHHVATGGPQLRDNYEDKLRLIGMHLDQANVKRAHIIEVPGGILARAAGSDGITEELLEFPDTAFETMFEDACRQRDQQGSDFLQIKTELIPTSYSDVLRSLGAWLDEFHARSVVISEGAGGLFVTGLRLEETSMHSRYAPFDEYFSPAAVDVLLTEAQNRRVS